MEPRLGRHRPLPLFVRLDGRDPASLYEWAAAAVGKLARSLERRSTRAGGDQAATGREDHLQRCGERLVLAPGRILSLALRRVVLRNPVTALLAHRLAFRVSPCAISRRI